MLSKKLRRKKIDLSGTTSEIAETLRELPIMKPIEVAIARTTQIIKDVLKTATPEEIEIIWKRLANDTKFELSFRAPRQPQGD